MKKLLSVLSVMLIIICAFAGCSSNDDSDLPEGQVATDDAQITGSSAIEYIQDYYTAEELGLSDVDGDYTFMVKTNGYVYDGDNYVVVNANIVSENEDVTSEDGQQTYSMETVGEYLISFDATTVLMKDMDADEATYIELESRIADYSAKSEDASTTQAEETE